MHDYVYLLIDKLNCVTLKFNESRAPSYRRGYTSSTRLQRVSAALHKVNHYNIEPFPTTMKATHVVQLIRSVFLPSKNASNHFSGFKLALAV